MKKFILLILALGAAIGSALASAPCRVTGRITTDKNEAVAFATVVMLRNGTQAAGTVSDADGHFSLQVAADDYTLSIQHLSYAPMQKEIRIGQDTDLHDLPMQTAATQIEGVEVKAQLVRREADRFVVDVANSPSSIGRDGIELLKNAPGVWIQDDKVSINGQSGVKVYINDRLLRMDDAQQAAYLRSLTAADIQKIEIIPITGADYDADSASGAIKITLKRRRDDGLNGNVQFTTYQSRYVAAYAPSGSIDYHSGRWSLNAGVQGTWAPKSHTYSEESTRYYNTDGTLSARSDFKGWDNEGGGRMGAIFEASDRHSIGLEAEYNVNNISTPALTSTDLFQQQILTRKESIYDQFTGYDRISATFNYIWKIDTLGSTFKLLADYNSNLIKDRNNYFTQTQAAGNAIDSAYRNSSRGDYRVTTVNAAFEKNFSKKITLRAGAKYTLNDTHNNTLYEYERDGWQTLPDYSYDIDYREHIAALYAAFSLRTTRWNLVAGVRGEYTRTTGTGSYIKQDYLSLFPNINLSYSFTEDGAYSLAAQYGRDITRPHFSTLNPMRIQISDYTYQIGNPLLRPSFSNGISLTMVMAYKYTITAGMNIKVDDINQTIAVDPNDPNMLQAYSTNYANMEQYYISAYLPFQLTKWWTANANVIFAYYGERITPDAPQNFHSMFHAGVSTTFTLPAKFFIDIDYYYRGKTAINTMKIGEMHLLNAGIKKRFWKDRLTASLSLSDILNQKQVIRIVNPDFERRLHLPIPWMGSSLKFSIAYNFKSGKAFRKRTIESGAAEEKGRL